MITMLPDGEQMRQVALGPSGQMFVETNPAPIKGVLARAGLIGSGHVRPPLVAPGDAARRCIDALLVAGAAMLDGPLAARGIARRSRLT